MSVPPTPTPTLDDDVADALNNPVNMLQEQNNRGTLVAVFGMSTWTFMRIIIGTEEDGAPFSNWEYPSVLSGLMKIFSCLLVSMIYYPIFCCITSRLTVAYLLGTVYCWSFAAYFIIFNLPQVCHNPTTDDARRYLLDVARKAPGLIFIAYICIAVTWQSIRSLCVQQNKQETFIDDEKDSYQVSRVKMLLKKRIKEENVTFDSKIIQIIEAKIYRNMPGFRYSITILAATTLSIILAYMIMMTIVEEWWLVSHIFEVLFDEYDELLLDAQNHSDDTKVLAASYVVKLFAALSSNATSAGSSEGESKAWEEFVYWFRMFSACVYAGCVIAFLLI
uniref:Gustatory receptor n=1 Tax=Plectus sambesii TaxID=2011161 RepID=A0A914UMK8_9BILA